MSSFVPGGTENQMIELARRLDPARFEVHVPCFHRTGEWLSRAEDRAVSLPEFPLRGFRNPATLRQVRRFVRWCRERQIAVLHATDIYANIFGLPAARIAGVPVRIANRREINPDKSAGLIALQRAGYACASRIVANSSAAAGRLREERVDAARISIVPNGLDLARYQRQATASAPRRVITVANLRQEKAHEILVEAAAPVLSRFPDAEFVMVGGGVRLDEIRALVRARGLHDRVRLLGHRDDVAQLLSDSHIFALPSRSEAMPNGILEAMAAGLPVVATRVGGIPEVVADGTTGTLVPADDAPRLAAALIDLMANPARAAAFGAAGRAFVEERFSFDRMVASFEHIYLSELQRRAPLRAGEAQIYRSTEPPIDRTTELPVYRTTDRPIYRSTDLPVYRSTDLPS